MGVTGGIGSGKSTVARLLAARGARVLDADAIVRELYRGGELPRRIAERFGPGAVADDGSVDRAALGRIVFDSEEERLALEGIVHPAVRERVLAELDAWRSEGFGGVVVIDAALLIEASAPYPLDALVVVTADEESRVERLARRGVPPEEARRRMRAQLGDDEKLRHADHRIDNGGTEADLEAAVGRLWEQLGRDERAQSG